MSTSKKKQQVRPEQKVKLIGKLAKGLGGKGSKADGLVPFFATADLPSPTLLENGCLAFDVNTHQLKITASGSWIVA